MIQFPEKTMVSYTDMYVVTLIIGSLLNIILIICVYVDVRRWQKYKEQWPLLELKTSTFALEDHFS